MLIWKVHLTEGLLNIPNVVKTLRLDYQKPIGVPRVEYIFFLIWAREFRPNTQVSDMGPNVRPKATRRPIFLDFGPEKPKHTTLQTVVTSLMHYIQGCHIWSQSGSD